MGVYPMAEKQEIVQPEQFRFDDDGVFPNSLLPLLVYRKALRADGRDPAWLLEERFANNDWCNSWRNGVYSFAHYHSTTHEILGVYCGVATLRLGGEHGRNLDVHFGDVIVIPAGVGHQKLDARSTRRTAKVRSHHRFPANSRLRPDLRRQRPIEADLEIRARCLTQP